MEQGLDRTLLYQYGVVVFRGSGVWWHSKYDSLSDLLPEEIIPVANLSEQPVRFDQHFNVHTVCLRPELRWRQTLSFLQAH